MCVCVCVCVCASARVRVRVCACVPLSSIKTNQPSALQPMNCLKKTSKRTLQTRMLYFFLRSIPHSLPTCQSRTPNLLVPSPFGFALKHRGGTGTSSTKACFANLLDALNKSFVVWGFRMLYNLRSKHIKRFKRTLFIRTKHNMFHVFGSCFRTL